MATKAPPAPKKSKPAAKAIASPPVPAAVDPEAALEAARAALTKAEAKHEQLDHWRDGYAESAAKVEALRADVATAEVRAMPLPPAMGLTFVELDAYVDLIDSTGNHRERIDDLGLQQLARSIQTHGLQQRIGIRADGDRYELIFGARRLAASKLAGLTEIPAKAYPPSLTRAEVEILRTIENFGRQDLTHAERALAVARTIDAIEATLAPVRAFGGRFAHAEVITSIDGLLSWAASPDGSLAIAGLTASTPSGVTQPDSLVGSVSLMLGIRDAGGLHAYVGQQLGFTARWVQDHAYVAQLGGRARELLAAGRITIGHARELAKLGDKAVADQIAGYCARDENGTGGRDVAWTHRQVLEHLRSLRGVGWELDIAFGDGVPGCTGYACKACRFNSKSDPDLFGGALADEPEAGVCTNEACFKAKTEITEQALVKLVVKAKPKVAAGKIEATENGIRELVPRHIRASTAARRVKRETTVAEPKPDAPAASSKPAKATPEETAQRKLDDAIAKRGRAIQEAMKVAVDADETGNRFAAMATLQFIEWEKFAEWGEEPSADDLEVLRDAADKTRQRKLVARALADDQWSRHVFEEFQWSDAALQIFVDAWALKVPPAPTLADFLPKPKAEKPARAIDGESEIDEAVRHCTHRVAGADGRWQKLRDAGATDDDIRHEIKDEFGTGGSGGPGYDYETRGSTLTLTIRKPIQRKLSGKPLVDRVRRVLAIPLPGEVAKSDPITADAGDVTLAEAIRAGEAEFGSGTATATFDEDPTFHSPADMGLTLEQLEAADCFAKLITAGHAGNPDVPEISIVRDRRGNGTDLAVVGKKRVNGRECWRLLEVANLTAAQAKGDADFEPVRGAAMADRARRGEFHRAVVRVGKSWRALIHSVDENAPPVWVGDVVAPPPPPRQNSESER